MSKRYEVGDLIECPRCERVTHYPGTVSRVLTIWPAHIAWDGGADQEEEVSPWGECEVCGGREWTADELRAMETAPRV